MSRERRRETGPTKPTEIDYVILVCTACTVAIRCDLEPPLVGGAQLRRWFSEHSRACECGASDWTIKAHLVGKPDVDPTAR